MSWSLVPNPEFPKDVDPSRTRVLCHDRSRYLTIRCSCGYLMHFHKTQIEPCLPGSKILTRCKSCRELLELDRDWLLAAIKEAWRAPSPTACLNA